MIKIQSLSVGQFRCFSSYQVTLGVPVVLITGENGVGKTTLLEAIAYASSMRSFRARSAKELIQNGKGQAAIRVDYVEDDGTSIQVTVTISGTRRTVRVNGKNVTNTKDIWQCARVVSVSEQDMEIVQGGPEHRRFFLDYGIMLHDYEYSHIMRRYRRTLEQRNAFLRKGLGGESFTVWTEGVFELSKIIRQRRMAFLTMLSSQVDELGASVARELGFEAQTLSLRLTCTPHASADKTFDEICSATGDFAQQERRVGRSLFGAHLDDVLLEFNDSCARTYASRGQQRLFMLILKMALCRFLLNEHQRVILVCDDVMADFDERRVRALIRVLRGLPCQLLLTSANAIESLVGALGADACLVHLGDGA